VRAIVFGFLVSSAVSAIAFADDASRGSAILQAAGIDGRWAVDCNSSASAANVMLTYVTPDNASPTEHYRVDPVEDHVTELLDVSRLKNGDLQWVIAEGEVMLTIVTQIKDNRLRTWSSSSSDGREYISKGKLGDGKPAPWFNKCETN
jgi:hypothetical protein